MTPQEIHGAQFVNHWATCMMGADVVFSFIIYRFLYLVLLFSLLLLLVSMKGPAREDMISNDMDHHTPISALCIIISLVGTDGRLFSLLSVHRIINSVDFFCDFCFMYLTTTLSVLPRFN